jgi:hypothetical protein|tara:strand:+ start:556 stop:813 length:258 start_codon:yes stop_codon:yes gene_type:complete
VKKYNFAKNNKERNNKMKHQVLNQIGAYIHCKKCLNELPEDQSPSEFAKTQTGWTEKGLQIWCNRHDLNIAHIDFLGQKVGYANV